MRLTNERTKRVEVPNDADGGFIIIRNLSMEEITQIESKYMTISSEGVSIKDYANKVADFARICLKSWGNFFEAEGSPLTFNAANIERVAQAAIMIKGEKVRFFDWVNTERENFAEEVEREETEAVKN